MLIKACLNGSRLSTDHAMLPLSAQELAVAAKNSYSLGIGAVHIHPRSIDGLQTLDAQACGEAVIAIRALCLGLPVGLSTGAWIEPDVARRVQLVSQWSFAPDFASVNFSEDGATEVFAALKSQGIGVEAGLSCVEDANLLVKSGLAEQCLRVLIEPDEADIGSALITVGAIIAYLNACSVQIPRLLHGSEGTAWPLLRHALQLGYDTRIGLEDTLVLPNGCVARDNAELVATAFSFLERNAMTAIEKIRCQWAKSHELLRAYHDEEWGVPIHEDRLLFEMLNLEGAQAGLSWLTVLKRRESYREAFDNFDAEKIVSYDAAKKEALLGNEGIIRNRLKIDAVVENARAFLAVQHEFGSFDMYIWQFVGGKPLSDAEKQNALATSELMSKDLKKRGFKFVGATICYAFMQAIGMVNDHASDCFRARMIF